MFFDIPMPVVLAFQMQSALRLKDIEKSKREDNDEGFLRFIELCVM